MPYFNLDSTTRLYYEVAGSGHPLVFIHGFTLDTRMWDDQFETFAREYQVVRYDRRGFGKSSLPVDEDYAHADDLAALLEHLGIDRAYVLGLSGGGASAIDFALTYPEAIDGLITVDTVLRGYQWTPRYGALLDEVGRRRNEQFGLSAPPEQIFQPDRALDIPAERDGQIQADDSAQAHEIEAA